VSVIIPARDAHGTLGDALAGLAAQRAAPAFEVIVVDDGSADATAELAAASAVVREVVRLRGAGPAQARNAGVAAARADRLAFLDADCVPTAEWLAAGARALERADLVVGETRPRPDQPAGPFDRTLSVVGRSPLFEGANLFVRRELFEAIGGFEGWLRPPRGKELGEDVWFGWRAVRAGARVSACPAALAHHAVYPRGALGFAAERWRLRFFPALARRVPELREELFYRRWFLTRRSACFDAAVAALLLAAVARRPLLAVGAAPYAHLLSRDVREPHGVRKVIGRSLADAVGLVALSTGAVRYRSLLL
jgi:glycosyltransferase involved in cell wall biosynthesis